MTHPLPHCVINDDIKGELFSYCSINRLNTFLIVTDQNIYPIFGQKIEEFLKAQEFNVKTVILQGNPVIPDEKSIVKILSELDATARTLIAIGSGTVTDLVRFVSSRTRSKFISLPTAPSMDGYASTGCALTLNGMKLTLISEPPIAIFADLGVLTKAPREMVASGFGDVIGKFTSLADWKLGYLLWDEEYSSEIAQRTRDNLMKCVQLIPTMEDDWNEYIHALIAALIDVGICMLLVGNSRPASGSEHHCSHYWELKHLREGRPDVSHGMKVGFAATLIAKKYEELRKIHINNAKTMLLKNKPIRREKEIEIIRSAYGQIADQIIHIQEKYLFISQNSYDQLCEKIIEKWDAIQQIASSVPSSNEIKNLLRQVGVPTNPRDLHITDLEVEEALQYSHYLRGNFTILKLFKLMGIQ